MPGSTPTPSPAATRRPLPARFLGTVSSIPPGLAGSMRGRTWHPGCPVPLPDLRLLTLRYWGFDGRVHQGPMVVNATAADEVVTVFGRLFRARFPIERIHLAIPFRGVDAPPTDRRDFTMGFNCRPALTARGPLASWSQHAYGLAIDVNPLQNPYVASDGFIRNYHSRRYGDRPQHLRGMIHPGDAVVRAFTSIGWTWGGDWSGDQDYMHFSLTGN
ncbi:MAG: M15 family metallopeptidase [Actinomycetota bacterium]|nr:M15 family metallopeptidase [Actinomycetota bacterium]